MDKRFILATSLQASLNVWRSRHIICLGNLAESRGRTMLSGVFHECLTNYIVCVYPIVFHLNKYASDSELSTLCLCIDYNTEFTKWKCILQCCKNGPLLFSREE